MLIPEYFSDTELSCGCGCGLITGPRATQKLYAIRCIIQQPMIINSSIRCESWNDIVGGVKQSWHKAGLAFDVFLHDERFKMELFIAAKSVGFQGFGFGADFMHIDLRDKFTMWTY